MHDPKSPSFPRSNQSDARQLIEPLAAWIAGSENPASALRTALTVLAALLREINAAATLAISSRGDEGQTPGD
jgi:hypothetical protein